MKKFLSYLAASLLFLSLIVTTGCEDDPIVEPPVNEPPSLDIGGGVFNGDELTFEISQVAPFTFTLTATTIDDDLNSVKLTENGGAMNLDHISVTGASSGIGSATVLLSGSDRAGFTWNVTYTPEAILGKTDIAIEVSDEAGATATVNFAVTIVEDPGTPLDATLTGVLFNQANPASGTGSLDLDEGKGSGVNSDGEVPKEQAEIRDMALDCTIAPANFNWRRQIGSFNGTEIRMVDLTQIENFTFDGVQIKEDIQNAYDTGTVLGSSDVISCSTGNVVATVNYVTPRLEVGDLFVVRKGDKYYLVRVDVIDEDGGANNTNTDSYTLSIKH